MNAALPVMCSVSIQQPAPRLDDNDDDRAVEAMTTASRRLVLTMLVVTVWWVNMLGGEYFYKEALLGTTSLLYPN